MLLLLMRGQLLLHSLLWMHCVSRCLLHLGVCLLLLLLELSSVVCEVRLPTADGERLACWGRCHVERWRLVRLRQVLLGKLVDVG